MTAARAHVLALLSLCACNSAARAPMDAGDAGQNADVLAVQVRGEPGSYTFTVAISSPDSGCDRYADWWEVVTPDGTLVYRRILEHSHVDEQPFARNGGPVAIAADREVLVRAHMHPGGYGGAVLRGTVAAGFTPDPSLGPDWASNLATEPPLPAGCAF